MSLVLNSPVALSYTCFHALLDTPMMATSGGFTMGENAVPPIPPKLEIVNVPPFISLGFSFFSRARELKSMSSDDKSIIDF